ncbi:MAG: hypothetical protein GY801_40925 [bacterium]|nr:hypothetical protein [bacterium]
MIAAELYSFENVLFDRREDECLLCIEIDRFQDAEAEAFALRIEQAEQEMLKFAQA